MAVETSEYVGMLTRCLRALGRRAGEGDLDALAAFPDLSKLIDKTMTEAARQAHDGPAGFSWSEIANVLGTSRQNARQRFGAER